MIAFLVAAFLVINVLGALILVFGRHLVGGNTLWIVLPVMALGIIASLAAAWKLYRNRYATAPLVTAAPGRRPRKALGAPASSRLLAEA